MDLLSVVKDEPFNPEAHARMGAYYWEQGRVEEALSSLTRALELDPRNKDAILNCSLVLRAFGRPKDAREVLMAYLAEQPDDDVRVLLDSLAEQPAPNDSRAVADFLNEQGESQCGLGRLDRARACFEMAIEAADDHSVAHCNLGVVCWEEGDVAAALEHLYRAMDLDPNDPDILHNAFQVLRAAGYREAAAELMEHYLRKGFGGETSWEAYAQLQREIGAATWSSDDLSSDVADIYASMGRALHAAGDRIGALEAFERALRIDSGNVDVYFQLGRVNQEIGDVTAACLLYRKSLDLRPEHEAARALLVELERELDRGEAGAGR